MNNRQEENKGQEESYEEGDNLAFLPADHHLLERFQIVLTKQLTNEHEQVDQELTEKDKELKQVEKKKEDIGVALYGVQQQLADNQMKFEQAYENHNLVQKLRLESEEKLNAVNDKYLQKKAENEELQRKYIKAQDELSKLNLTIKGLQSHIEEMTSAIKVTKIGTLRAEENVVSNELVKKQQDYLLDSMNEQVKKLIENRTILRAQIQSQKEETENAKAILKDAQLEMEKINASKANLLERWQKAIHNMQRRDNALQAIKDAMKQEKEININLGNELMGLNNEINNEHYNNEELVRQIRKLKNERKYLANQKLNLEEQEKKLQSQIKLLEQSLNTTEVETKKVDLEQKQLDDNMIQIESNIMKLHTETKKLIENLIHEISEHKTIEKTAANLLKQTNLTKIEIEDKEVELENLLNEYARVQIDKLNTNQQIEELERKKKEVLKEKEDKEITVATYEVQIRQGHDLNGKKQHEVGRLNKQYDELCSQTTESNRGPLEAQRNGLKRSRDEHNQKIEEFKREWTKKQTQLVTLNNQLEAEETELNHLRVKQTILEQKKLRLNNNYKGHDKEIQEIQNTFKNLQTEMNRLNDRLATNISQENKLKNENINNESEFIQRLKDMEKEAVSLEVQVDWLREQKADLLADIVEHERQILLWERKIHLEKEMQETLDPTYGQKELEELKKDIHRMELRLDDLRKKQESVISDIEKAVSKKEMIQLKYQNKDKNQQRTKNKKELRSLFLIDASQQQYYVDQPSTLTKQINNLKGTLNTTTQHSKQIDLSIRQTAQELDAIAQQIELNTGTAHHIEREVYEANNSLSSAKIRKLINITSVSNLQLQAKKYDELLQKKAKLFMPESQLRARLNEQRQQNENVKEALLKVLNDHPQYQFILQQLIEL